MKKIFLLVLSFLIIQNLYANNPIVSPTFDSLLKEFIKNDKYIFDDKNITIKVPSFADNPIQVPIFVDAKKIKNAKRVIVFADLNPIPKIIDMNLENGLLPIISVNIKVAQETPLRALILDDKNIWHIGSKNIKSFGGGCSVSSVASGNSDYDKLLGKGKAEIFKNENSFRIKSSIFHPMETGLIFGNTEFYINKIVLKANNKEFGEVLVYSAVSENPRFIFETNIDEKEYKLEFIDTDSNKFIQTITKE